LSDDYACACSFYGVCIFSEATNNPQLLGAVIDKYQPYVTGQKTPRNPGHVDWNVFGILPFELYRQTGNYDDYVPLAKFYADTEFENPRPDGLSPYTRFWVDDMYMVGSLQAQAYKNLQDPKYINNGVTQLWDISKRLKTSSGPTDFFITLIILPSSGVEETAGPRRQ
jgi:rhamnogalacturonyl hydrolase YesR